MIDQLLQTYKSVIRMTRREIHKLFLFVLILLDRKLELTLENKCKENRNKVWTKKQHCQNEICTRVCSLAKACASSKATKTQTKFLVQSLAYPQLALALLTRLPLSAHQKSK